MEKKELASNLPEVKKEDFVFVHENLSSKILDEKLKTKPTTFAKDAFKRFCKNKSSVVGAIIIGILLLGSFLAPVVSPYDVDGTFPEQALMLPKLNKSGSGFWDGTTKYKNRYFDRVSKLPVGGPNAVEDFYEFAIIDSDFSETVLSTNYEFGWGGYVYILSSQIKPSDNSKLEKKFVTFSTKTENVTLTQGDNAKINFVIDNKDLDVSKECQKYRCSIMYDNGGTNTYLRGDWQTCNGSLEFDISSLLSSASIDSVSNVSFILDGLPSPTPENKEYQYSHMLIKSAIFSSNNNELNSSLKPLIDFKDYTEEEEREALNNGVTLYDANQISLGGDVHWLSTGSSIGGYGVHAYKGTLVYDNYAHVFGDRQNFTIGQSVMQTYLDNGWCEFEGTTNKLSDYDATFDLSTHKFKVLSDKCPVKEVSGFTYDKMPTGDYAFQFVTVTTFYKYKGYDKMPAFLFGTDAEGRDLLTLALSCLKTSLLVAIISSAVCLVIGLIWGSISGYFGGTVDIVMERITDILSGIPWIVLMTLIILNLGNSVTTFAIALIITDWIGTAATTRTQFYRFRDREYVLASRTLGASDGRLIFRHILPNGLGTIVTSSVLMIPGCIFSEASISYLGLGLKGVNSFGVLLSKSQAYISSRPIFVVVPAVIISLLMISFNLFGNGLRDALNPTLKGGEQ